MTEETAEAAEPHEPSPQERAARDRVRRQAGGMTHHETAEALEAAEDAAGDLAAADAGTRAAVAEWQRITDVLFDHGGPYSPDTDAYVQGQLTARENRRPPADTGPPLRPPAGRRRRARR
ncbi:hypothetical protein [Streptomyces sp. CB00455]|uniref:hypothetical protein n=1 Tax=Streptomyces sp. CB00455 TaxID=1703927 RepID=UPI000B05602E|nr:hypothetical protein [Streptomyces sp. CB00455]